MNESTNTELARVVGMNIYQRLHAIMCEVGFLAKTKKIKNSKGTVLYSVVESEALDNSLKPLLKKYRVLIIPSIKNSCNDRVVKKGQYDNQKDSEENHTAVNVEVRWVNIDRPDDFITGDWPGMGIDSGDKSTGKAITYAMRFCKTKTLNMSTGDPEPEDPREQNTAGDNDSAFGKKQNPATAPGDIPPNGNNANNGEVVHQSKAEAFLNFANALKLDIEKDVTPYLNKNNIQSAYDIPVARFDLLRNGLKLIEKTS